MKLSLLALSLLPCFALAQDGMWNQLATSPYRLDTTDVHALKVEMESLSFFRNNEFESRQADGYSLPGFWVQLCGR